jgi:hypothetical protein
MANLHNAARMLESFIAADIPVMVWGAPGIGKSDIVREIAGKLYGGSLIDFRALLRDPVDLRGIPVPDVATGRTIWLRPSDLPFIGNDGADSGILFMDEINAAPPSMMAACFGLVLDRRCGEHTLKPGWRIVAAGNRQSDRGAAQKMPTPLRNRFAHIEVEPDVETFVKHCNAVSLNPVVPAFVRFRKPLLHLMPGQKPDDSTLEAIPTEANAFPTPRAWFQVAKVANAAEDIRQALVAGLIGEGPAAEFEGFCRTWKRIPPLADILANPHGVMVPDHSEPALLYAVTMALSRVAAPTNFAAVLAYAQRLPREFEILIAVDSVKRESALAETSAFVQWAVRNQDVTL